MRAVVQRVSSASVKSTDEAGDTDNVKIERGLLILLGVKTDDTQEDARWLSDKIAGLRIFEDEQGKLNLSLREIGGSALVVSNFTLYGDCRKGRRPSFSEAASGPVAQELYLYFGSMLSEQEIPVKYGMFGAHMQVSLENDGPVTLVIDSPRRSDGRREP
jgi:D-tyrosyl-tRNA(Tyr) deacylase